MRVLLFSTYRPDIVDGASNSMHELVNEFKKQKLDFTICATDMGWSKKQIEFSGKDTNELRVFHSFFSCILEISPALIWFFYKNIKSYDIIHFRGFFSLGTVFGALIARWFKKPYIISPVGDRVPLWSERKTVSCGTIKYLYFKLIIRRVLRGASCIICASDSEINGIKKLVNFRNIKCVAIPNGINSLKYSESIERSILQKELNIGPEKIIYLFLGRLSKEKALEFLLETWENFIAQKKDGILVIAGSNKLNAEYVSSLEKKISELNLSGSVLMPGNVSGSLKLALLQHSCCLLLPSYRESFGNVVLESLISGTPVIASKGTPWEALEINKLGCWLDWDKELWSEAMLEQADNRSMKDVFSTKSKKWVNENFSWEKAANSYLEIYQEASKQTT
jgi:glycosyltransferase involved in cell wall biosynthesis